LNTLEDKSLAGSRTVLNLAFQLLFIVNTFVKCNWVDTRWQQYSTQNNTNST